MEVVAEEADVVVDGGGAVIEGGQVPLIAKQEPVPEGAAIVVLGGVNYRRVDQFRADTWISGLSSSSSSSKQQSSMLIEK